MKSLSDIKVNDRKIEVFIGNFLRLGVLASCVVALAGGILYLFKHGMETMPDYTSFHGEDASYTSLPGILQGLGTGSAKEIIQLGVIILIATPILRIFLSLISFILEKDRLYVLITTLVLGIILTSMFGGLKL